MKRLAALLIAALLLTHSPDARAEGDEGGTRFVQREEFRGVLVTPLLAWVGKSTLAGFKQMNEALKERAEARV